MSTHADTTTAGIPALRRIVGWAALSLALLGVLAYLLWLSGVARDRPQYVDGEYTLTLSHVIDGRTGSSPEGFDRPLSVALAPDGSLFVADTGNNRICVFDRSGRFLRSFGGFGIAKPLQGFSATWQPGLLNFPAGIDIGDDGLLYVADFRNDQICAFTLRGEFVRAFPEPEVITGRGGSGQDGTGIAVTDVCARHGRVYATDTYQVMIFDTAGRLLRQFGRPGSPDQDLDHPNGIAVARDGSLLVSDSNHTRVASFSTRGEPRWSLSGWPSGDLGGGEEAFGLPRGMAVRPDGVTVVADAVRHELVVVTREGRVAATLGRRGVADGEFNFPVDVAAAGDTIAVADKENDRIQVFTLERNVKTTSTAQKAPSSVKTGAFPR